MRRYVSSHTNRNTGSTVYKQIRITAGQNLGFFLRIVKVGSKINGIFIDICQKLHGNFAQPCLRITHGRRSVAVHGTEISVSVHKRISGRPFLRHINKCSIDGTVTVGVIFTHRITDDTGTLSVRLVRAVIQLDHGIENPALYRLQTVSYIRKRTGRNNAHGIIYVRIFHLFFEIYFLNLVKNSIIHPVTMFLSSKKLS